jgi:hypothetical protein
MNAFKNGINYEKYTSLKNNITVISNTNKFYQTIKFNNSDKKFIHASKSGLFKYMKSIKRMNGSIKPAHGCKSPDECFIDESTKKIFIIEKKFQSVAGSACEKIQTPDFKIWQYRRLFPVYTIMYIYCLSSWFEHNCKSELEYLDNKNIKYLIGDDPDYKSKMIDIMLNNNA